MMATNYMAPRIWLRFHCRRVVGWLLNATARLLAWFGLLVYPGIERGRCEQCGALYKAWFPRLVVKFEDTAEYDRYFRHTVSRCKKCGCPFVAVKLWKDMAVYEPTKRSVKMGAKEKEQAIQKAVSETENREKMPARMYYVEKRSGGVDKVWANALSPTDRDFAFYLETKLVYVIPRDNLAAVRVQDEKPPKEVK